jgi:hypothetical protein
MSSGRYIHYAYPEIEIRIHYDCQHGERSRLNGPPEDRRPSWGQEIDVIGVEVEIDGKWVSAPKPFAALLLVGTSDEELARLAVEQDEGEREAYLELRMGDDR